VADESLFTSQVPLTMNFDATAISVGIAVVFALPGVIKALKYYATPTQSGGTHTGGVYSIDTADSGTNDPGSGTGTQLATATYGALTPGAWNTATLSTPLLVSAGVPYRIEAYSSVGRYGSTTNLFASSLVNGNITGIATNTTVAGKNIRNSTYNYATNISYANDYFGEGYFVDVVYEASATAASLVIPRRPSRGLVMR
jgi:hypothetical protein